MRTWIVAAGLGAALCMPAASTALAGEDMRIRITPRADPLIDVATSDDLSSNLEPFTTVSGVVSNCPQGAYEFRAYLSQGSIETKAHSPGRGFFPLLLCDGVGKNDTLAMPFHHAALRSGPATVRVSVVKSECSGGVCSEVVLATTERRVRIP